MNRRTFLTGTAGGLLIPTAGGLVSASAASLGDGLAKTGITFVPREKWAGKSLANPSATEPMKKIVRLTFHHDGMPVTPIKTSSQIEGRIKSIRASHSRKGYADIGYHFIVDPHGKVWEGRPVKYQGAHVRRHNFDNIGIVMLGNYQVQRPTDKSLDSIFALAELLMKEFGLSSKKVFTHREITSTVCPGKNLQPRFDTARKNGGAIG